MVETGFGGCGGMNVRERLPYWQVYPGDIRKDLAFQTLSYHYRGIWWELLMLMHCSEDRGRLVSNGAPIGTPGVARLLGLSEKEAEQAIQVLTSSGVASRDESGALICRRMVREQTERKAVAERVYRYRHKTRIGNTDCNGDVTPNDNDGDSLTVSENGRTLSKAPSPLKPAAQQRFAAWVKVRKAMGKKPKDWTAMFDEQEAWLTEFTESDQIEILSQSIRNNWQGLFPPKRSGHAPVLQTRQPTWSDRKALKETIDELQEKKNELFKRKQRDGREFTAEEQQKYDALSSRLKQLKAV